MSKFLKKSYDIWDYPSEFQVPQAETAPIAKPEVKVRKKPGPKPKPKPEKVSEPLPAPPPAPEAKTEPEKLLIKRLVDDIRGSFEKVEIQEPIAISISKDAPPSSYVSNIVLDGERIGYFQQSVGGDRVFLRFEKSNHMPIWNGEKDTPRIVAKIKEEIEKFYIKKVAAKLGYRIAIKTAAHRRGL